jgi:hypothetical protein
MDFLRFLARVHLARAADASFARVADDIRRRPTLCFFAVSAGSPNSAARRLSSRSISRRIAKAFCSFPTLMLFIGSTLTRTRYISPVFYISTNTMGRKTVESHCEHIKLKFGCP